MKLEELLVPEGPVCGSCIPARVERLTEIEDIEVIKSFMIPNNCHNEGCYIEARKDGKEIFLLCTTYCGFYYEDFFIIDCKYFDKAYEWYKVRNAPENSLPESNG